MGIRQPVLIVDDDARARETLGWVLTLGNYEVCEAGNGLDALAVLKTKIPHVVVSDLQMPEMDGYALLQLIAGYFPEIGVIVLSGTIGQSHGKSRPVIADAYFAKGSFRVQTLLDCIKDLAGRFPVRPTSRPGTLSVSWCSQQKPKALSIVCRKCLSFFAIADAAARFCIGIQRISCPSCSAQVEFLLDERVWQKLAKAA